MLHVLYCSFNLKAKESGRVKTLLSQRESVVQEAVLAGACAALRGGESDLSRCIVAPAHRARRAAD